jgi:2-polyprenyl-3-methyl-5-hydroxy-6-metoxy-1,4-benzoquinol methylase
MTGEMSGDASVIYEAIRAPEEYAAAYNALMAEPTNTLRVRAVAGALRLVNRSVRRVVDVASGAGAYVSAAGAALQGNPRFFAVDRQYACVGGYRINHPEAVGTMASVTSLPFTGAAFDLALCLDIIEHLDDDVAFLREVGRVLAPGGWIVVSTHNARSLEHLLGLARASVTGETWRGWDPTHVRFYTARSLGRALAAADFEIVAFRGTYYWPFHFPARVASWPLARLGFTRAAKVTYRLIAAPGYALNAIVEALSAAPVIRACGWGVIALARKREA